MKKLLIMLLMMVGLTSINTYAQRATVWNSTGTETLVNADTSTFVLSVTAGYAGIYVQPVLTKTSGTVAGKFYTYKSNDGTNYTITADSITLANQATNTSQFSYSEPLPVYYKFVWITSGTQASVPKIYYVLRKHD